MADAGERRSTFFVAVHAGAGFHAHSNEKFFKKALKCACLAAASVLLKVFSDKTSVNSVLLKIVSAPLRALIFY